MWRYFSNNPVGRKTGDCAVRAISLALGISWDDAHDMLSYTSKIMGDVQPSNAVIAAVLRQNGFYRKAIPNTCPDCYTANDFCDDNPYGIFVLGFGEHVATVIDGDIYDMWDSSNEIPQYVWYQARKDG